MRGSIAAADVDDDDNLDVLLGNDGFEGAYYGADVLEVHEGCRLP
jgi:hypothetical protein